MEAEPFVKQAAGADNAALRVLGEKSDIRQVFEELVEGGVRPDLLEKTGAQFEGAGRGGGAGHG